ncbi:rhodanese-like domain-containing protein [Macrococcus hajekii]|uniref:Rhodanese-like domain-containing protein n=1 Tax=Macrococcus hajekii TaxID=198482 RepID=A0A4R6BJW9_9STAP|nr:rhodanese-like domain-containing protein [Macrococcus hajekii]TDM01998.1 rhodanese-like domain-containing protein [Macrococcus hajekii]GGB09176.1 rhodanese-like domain-containing protein [Macrococcus hajekii]
MKLITVEELETLINNTSHINLIDVREEHEFAEGHIDEAKNIPLSCLEEHTSEFLQHEDYYLICRSGKRSETAGRYLAEHHIHTTNIEGGMLAWDKLHR